MPFPYEDPIDVGELLGLDESLVLAADDIVAYLDGHLTEHRKQRIDAVVRERTFSVISVMEGIYDLGNAAAVLRSAEGMGYQEAHVIHTQEHQKTSQRITQGADKWMDVHEWEEPAACIDAIQKRGYRVVATHLDADKRLAEIDFTEPTALVFGNESDGVSDEVCEMADDLCIIPIRGFVESFNISVAAALSLYEAMRQRVDRLGRQGDLTERERGILKAHFYIRATRRPDRLIPALHRRGLEQE